MNALTQTLTSSSSPDTTMSSLEIAELTEKRHDNVKSDIRTMLFSLGRDILSFQDIYRDSMNREQSQYLLPKDLTFTLVAGYSIPLRHKVVTRWLELEAAAYAAPAAALPAPYAVPQTFAQALQLDAVNRIG